MDMITIGVITNTQGLKGTVKVKSFTDFKEQRYQIGNTLYILFKDEYIPVTVDNVKTVKGLEYLDFKEFNDINQVEQFKSCELFIDKSDVPPLEEDDYFVRDLIGCICKTDVEIGEVVDVREYPQGEYLVVKRKSKKQVIIPFMKQFVESVDIENKTIVIYDMEGLL